MDADGRSHSLPPRPPGSCRPVWEGTRGTVPFPPLPTRRRCQPALRLRTPCLLGTLSSADTEGSGGDNRSGCESSAGAPRGTDEERFSEAGGCASGPSRDLGQVQTHGVCGWAAALVADSGQVPDPGGPSQACSAAQGLSPSSGAFLSPWSLRRPLQSHAGEGGPVDGRSAGAMVPPWKDVEGERVRPTCRQPLRRALSADAAPLFCPDRPLRLTAEASASGVLRRPLHRRPSSEGVLGSSYLRPGPPEKARGVREERRPLLRAATPRSPERRGRWEPAADGAAGLCEVQAEAERESLHQEVPLGPRPDQPKNRPPLLDERLILVALCLQDFKLGEEFERVSRALEKVPRGPGADLLQEAGDSPDRSAPQTGEYLPLEKRPLSPPLPAATSGFPDRPGSPQPPSPPPNSPSFCWAGPPGAWPGRSWAPASPEQDPPGSPPPLGPDA